MIPVWADRVEFPQDGSVVGEHRRVFGRDQTVFDPWHYVPVLARKPGALRNGAPFKALRGLLPRLFQRSDERPPGLSLQGLLALSLSEIG